MRKRLTLSFAAAALLVAAGCGFARTGPSPPGLVGGALASQLELSPDLAESDVLRIVLVGDTGEGSAERARILGAIREEEKDLVAVLGDLVYERSPRCPEGVLTPSARAVLDDRIGDPFSEMGAPVLLVLGNHDVVRSRLFGLWKTIDPTMEACFLAYGQEAAERNIHLPSRHFALEAGPVAISVVTSTGTYLDDDATALTASTFDADPNDWDLLLAHDVYKTFHDKESERHLREWVQGNGLRPDIVAHGHAHFLQAGIYDGVLALTSGGGSRQRAQPRCAQGEADPGRCGPGQLFGNSDSYGYLVLEFAAEWVLVTFKSQLGEPLWACRVRQRGQCDYQPLP